MNKIVIPNLKNFENKPSKFVSVFFKQDESHVYEIKFNIAPESSNNLYGRIKNLIIENIALKEKSANTGQHTVGLFMGGNWVIRKKEIEPFLIVLKQSVSLLNDKTTKQETPENVSSESIKDISVTE